MLGLNPSIFFVRQQYNLGFHQFQGYFLTILPFVVADRLRI